ncbi:MAG: hypothetical protein J7M13_01315 [Synergistetes bacterium]|nr:hypothetical protein [Synergistota bacterium]
MRRWALTFVETLVVVAIIAVIALVLVQTFLGGFRVYRHGISREDMIQNARLVLDTIRNEMVSEGITVSATVSCSTLISDENHDILEITSSGATVVCFGCYPGKKLPDGENVYILGRCKNGSSPTPLTDGYDGEGDPYWVSVEEFKIGFLPGNASLYGETNMPNKGVYIYLKLSGPGGAEGKSYRKGKIFEVSTIIYLRR